MAGCDCLKKKFPLIIILFLFVHYFSTKICLQKKLPLESSLIKKKGGGVLGGGDEEGGRTAAEYVFVLSVFLKV